MIKKAMSVSAIHHDHLSSENKKAPKYPQDSDYRKVTNQINSSTSQFNTYQGSGTVLRKPPVQSSPHPSTNMNQKCIDLIGGLKPINKDTFRIQKVNNSNSPVQFFLK